VALKSLEDLMTLYDITGMCKFTRGLTLAEGTLDLANAMTGFDYSMSEFMSVGERVYNVSKAYNIREGFGREDDMIPPRFTEELPDGPTEGESIDCDAYERELDRYYAVRGWDTEGTPLRETLNELDLPEIGDELGAANEMVPADD
ncbi:MAG: aldehyde ferredoxin oxidoreductase C-terminal domain-containing protein, partial [Halobacteriales archaeon]